MADFLQAVLERVVIYDGAMGTNIQFRNPSVDDFWGKEGCNELLVLSRPDIINDIHASFFTVGCDVVETNTFGATRVVLAEYDLQDKVAELNIAAAKIAKEVAQQFSTKDKPRFVAGSIGPTTKLPSLGHIKFDDMVAGYFEQARALIEGGVDVLLIETSQDLLQAKAAVVGVFEAMQKAGKRLPVTVQVTLEATGTMLLGTEIGAALTALEPFDVDIIGLNCATGPIEMYDAVRFLGANSSKHVSVLPNAGLPQNEGGRAVYKLRPEELATYHKHFVQDYGVRIVGGCCGTTPEHLQAVVNAVGGIEPAKREVKPTAAASSAYTSVPLDLDPKPLVVAEEMNTTTRVEHFRNLVRGKKYDDILTLAKRLVNDGSHMLDLCCAIVGEGEKGYITSILEKIATRVPAPILVDSTEADVVEEALKRIPGKAIINSINLEDGEKRTSKVLPMAKRYGAAVIALTIDEEGMALTAEKKVAIAKRIHNLATEKYGIRPIDLIFDALTLPITTGQEEYRTAGIETLNAIERIKKELPEVKTILGVSNISFGLDVYPRRVLNSVFMHEAVDHGLDMAIVNYTKIYPLYKIPYEEVELAHKLIYRDESAGDPLQIYMRHFAGTKGKVQATTTAHVETLSVADKLNLGIKQPADSIIKAAQEHKADAIGLSRLLVKSTLEMKYVIQDLERQKLVFPVLCGGAALTHKYVEDDLRREYSNAVSYSDHAFGGLHIMEDLASPDGKKETRLEEGRKVKEYAKAVAVDEESGPVFAERSPVVGDAPSIPEPPFWGVRVKKDYDLRELFRFIHDTALFKNQWQLKTASQEDYLRLVEQKFRPIKKQLEEEVIGSGIFEPQVVWGYFPCRGDGNDVVVYEPEQDKVDHRGHRGPQRELVRFTFARQREGRKLCISDFFAPKSSGKMDVIGFSLVTMGAKVSQETQRLFEGGEYTRYLYLHGLSVETAEALAEYHHKLMREELGIAGDDSPHIRDLFHQKYRGSRYSFGYPACPNLEDQTKLFALLHPEENVGVRLTSTFLLEPEQSTSAIVVHHPAAKYFVA